MAGVDENLFFREATLRLCSSLDIEAALKGCYEYIRQFIPVRLMNLAIRDPDENTLWFVALVGEGLPGKLRACRPFAGKDASGEGGFFQICRSRPHREQARSAQSVLRGTGKARTKRGLFLHGNGLGSLEGNQIGDVAMVADGVNRYTDEHARLLRLLREPFAIAMSNALKHQEVLRFKQMLADDNRYLRDELRSVSGDEIIGTEFGLSAVMRMVEQVSPSTAPCSCWVKLGRERSSSPTRSTAPQHAGTGLS